MSKNGDGLTLHAVDKLGASSTSQKQKVRSCHRKQMVYRSKSHLFFFSVTGALLTLNLLSKDKQCYLEVLIRLRDAIRKKCLDLWPINWLLRHVHDTLTTCPFLDKKQISQLDHPFYSPDLMPCDLFKKNENYNKKDADFVALKRIRPEYCKTFQKTSFRNVLNSECMKRIIVISL